MKADIIVWHNGTGYYPAVREGITLSLERKGSPGKLTFSVVPDGVLNFTEGDACKLTVDGADMFYGYVFTKKRNKDGLVTITAYDQLRYLKNKDVFQYKDKTATDVIRMLADDFLLQTGVLEDTKYRLPGRTEDGTATLFDLIQDALDETLTATGRMYVLYDDAGKLTLRDIESMKLDLLLDADTLENFDYASGIDSATYNQIKVVHTDKDSGVWNVYIAQDGEHINQWGVLRLTEKVTQEGKAKAKADALLSLYNEKTRTLTATNVLGRTDVRAGSSIAVLLELGDISVSHYMVAESVQHTFNEEQHLMRLRLRGGTFVV